MAIKWNKGASPGEKLLGLFSLLLFTSERYSLTALSEKLECSKQTILRLIEQIEASKWAKIQRGEQGREAVYWIDRPSSLLHASFNIEELERLMLCHNFLEYFLPNSPNLRVDAALQQSCTYVSEKQACAILAAGGASKVQTKGRIDYSHAQGFVRLLINAATSKKVCEVTYQVSKIKKAHTFNFAPMRLIAQHESLYILGWVVTDIDRVVPIYADPSLFLIHRLKSVALTRRTWKQLPDPGSDSAIFGLIRQQPFKVSLKITTTEIITYIEERIWSADQEIINNEDGSITLNLTAQGNLETTSWILSLGSAAEVLSPDWLRADIQGEIAILADRYRV